MLVRIYNSSETPVPPVINVLFWGDSTGTGWPSRLWVLGTRTRAGQHVASRPADVEVLVADEVVVPDDGGRPGGFEGVVTPSTAFFRWLLRVRRD